MRLQELKNKGWKNLTKEERAEYKNLKENNAPETLQVSDLLINELWSELRDADARAAVLEFRNTNTPELEMLQVLSKDKRLIKAGGNELQVLHNAINRLQPKD